MTFFCFSIIRRAGYELDIVKNQLAWNAGIFACDGYAVLCDKKLVLGGSAKKPFETIPFTPAKVGLSKDKTAANAQLFMNAWNAVKTSADYSNYDWTLKVDPDAVLIPDRLRPHLVPFSSKPVYVKQCGKWIPYPGWPKMYGSVEIFSRQAVQAYFEGEQRCKSGLQWQQWGEDIFMGQCLDYLGVGTSNDLGVISDALCKGVDCGDSWAAAFHPFKSTGEWMQCWRKATGNVTKLDFQHEVKPESETEETFAVGDKVRVRDSGDEDWRTGTVTAVSPLKVLSHGGYMSKEWKIVEPVGSKADDENDQKETESEPETEPDVDDRKKRKTIWVKKLKK
jgi:hypothetical protein